MRQTYKLYSWLTRNSSFVTLKTTMPEVKKRRTLHLKLFLIALFASFFPITIIIFAKLDHLILLIIGALTSMLAILLLFRAIKPLSKLIAGFEILSDGKLNHTLDIRTGDEFEDLALSFNLMATKIAALMQNIEKEQVVVSAERNRLDLILSSIIDGIIALDFSKNVILVNKATEYLTGFTAHQMQDRPIDEFVKFYKDGEEIFIKSICQSDFNQAATLVGKDGKQTKVNVTSASIAEGIQTNLGCIIILHDLSKEEELEQMKLDFVSMASHELKTPITSIIGYLSVFLNENRSKLPREEADLLERSLISAQQLLNLVQNILNVNKIERDQLSVDAEPVDYLAILSKVVEDVADQAKLKNIDLTLDTPQTSLPKVMADQVRIAEVITNLIANAINYTNPGGRVIISTSVSPTEVTTTIEDTGIGIPKEALPYLFNKFFRVSNQEQPTSKGTGLGLYIAKSIINRLNGRIWVESEFEKGSKFSFTLPIASAHKDVAVKMGTLNY